MDVESVGMLYDWIQDVLEDDVIRSLEDPQEMIFKNLNTDDDLSEDDDDDGGFKKTYIHQKEEGNNLILQMRMDEPKRVFI